MNNIEILKIMKDHQNTVIKIRHDLHRIPEIGNDEKKTSNYICDVLRSENIPFVKGIAGYGILASITTGNHGPNLLFRADMDALPIKETTGLPFSSQHTNIMHACAHDAHMAIILTVAIALNKAKEKISAGSIKFVFQPAEEGPGGAELMIKEGVMENPKVDYVFGCHIWPGIAEGSIGIKVGTLMAAFSNFHITIKGSGGHGATPHLCIDPIDTGCQIVNSLHRIISRHTKALNPTVLTVNQFNAGSATNIIPETTKISGTIRAFDYHLLNSITHRIEKIVNGICYATGATYSIDFTKGYPPTINDKKATEIITRISSKVFGPNNIISLEKTMGSEDIAFFLQEAKGSYFFIGSGSKKYSSPLHNPNFDFNEQILINVVEIFYRIGMSI